MSVQAKLSVPVGLCLVRMTGPIAACGNAGACYMPNLRQILLFKGSPFGGEPNALYHEKCHAHQHQVALQAGLGDNLNSFFATAEGKAFTDALTSYKTYLALIGQTYQGPGGGTLLEDYAQFCAGWYQGDYPPTAQFKFISDYARLYWLR